MASGLAVADTPTADLIRLMTGRSVENVFPPAVPVPDDAPTVLEVEGLALAGVFEDVSFSVRAGEVVGLAGLVGSGRSEILETVYGARRATAGTVQGRPARRCAAAPSSTRSAPASASRPRSARARAWCSTSRSS